MLHYIQTVKTIDYVGSDERRQIYIDAFVEFFDGLQILMKTQFKLSSTYKQETASAYSLVL